MSDDPRFDRDGQVEMVDTVKRAVDYFYDWPQALGEEAIWHTLNRANKMPLFWQMLSEQSNPLDKYCADGLEAFLVLSDEQYTNPADPDGPMLKGTPFGDDALPCYWNAAKNFIYITQKNIGRDMLDRPYPVAANDHKLVLRIM